MFINNNYILLEIKNKNEVYDKNVLYRSYIF